MGVRVGQIPTSHGKLDAFTARRRARAEEGQLLETRQGNQEETVRAGFGKDSVSNLGAAYRAVSSNLKSARQIVPTVEELQVEAQESAAAARVEEARQEAPAAQVAESPTTPTVTVKPKPEPFARLFAKDERQPEPVATAAIVPNTTPTANEQAAFEGIASAATEAAPAGSAAQLNLLA